MLKQALSPAIALTQRLIRDDTINPPGNETETANYVAQHLRQAGFAIDTVLLADGRPNLIAHIGGSSTKPPLAFTGHLDTVPLGLAPWTVAPHGGDIKDGKIWGRGASDMKAGV
ncbi:MAG: M20/M25/M40 family metallo-hydrolase, partial [Hyphomicrobiaceae bacterium]|nr:M20/M25/M40 family metallo-hydrolase [Hyphomicrobiaceae bacterium]